MKKTTVLMVAVLAIATVLAAGRTAVLGSIQEAQANPCSTEIEGNAGGVEPEYNCDFEGIGSLTIVEGGGGLTEAPIILPTP
jgi:hypothetical protein